MAISIRRAILSCRNISPSFRNSRSIPHLAAPSYVGRIASNPSPVVPKSPAIGFLFESRRCFAKGRKKISGDDDDTDDFGSGNGDDENKIKIMNIGPVFIGPVIMAGADLEMEAAIDAVSHELSKLRTGRASAGMLDHVIVETGGVKMPLNRMAVVSVLDPKTLSVTPYNPNALKELEKAIISSPLGLNPKPDGERLITVIPPMTKEHMQAVCKVVAKSSEDAKQRIRRARQKALDTIKKCIPKKSEGKDKGKEKEKMKAKMVSVFSTDDAKRLEKEIEELTKKYSKSVEDACKAKEKEITSS